MADKMLDKISKVLKLAENASTPEEAATYMAKAQELASANAIDLAVARAHQADREKRQTPEKRVVRLDSYSGRERISPTTKWKCELFLVVAEVNDIKCLISSNQAAVFPYGFPGDLDVAEALYNSLVVQMVAAADDGLNRGLHKEKQRVYKTVRVPIPEENRAWGEWSDKDGVWYDVRPGRPNDENYYSLTNYRGTSYPPPKTRLEYVLDEEGNRIIEDRERVVVDGRVWRANFYEGFISRIRSRLWEAKTAARKAYDAQHGSSDETGLVLRSKALEVADFYRQDIGDRKLGTYSGASTSGYSSQGREHGQRAGAAASLGTEARVASSGRKAVE